MSATSATSSDTTDEDLDRAFDAIGEIRSSRSWERWQGQPALVT